MPYCLEEGRFRLRPDQLPKLLGAADGGKGNELPNIPYVIVAGIAVAQMGEPFGFREDRGQSLKLCRRSSCEERRTS